MRFAHAGPQEAPGQIPHVYRLGSLDCFHVLTVTQK
jgi:hypothetical protein